MVSPRAKGQEMICFLICLWRLLQDWTRHGWAIQTGLGPTGHWGVVAGAAFASNSSELYQSATGMNGVEQASPVPSGSQEQALVLPLTRREWSGC